MSRAPQQLLDPTLWQGMYLTYARNAKFHNARSQKRIDFMALCIVEIYSMDNGAAYQHAFIYIRQLAVDLRQVRLALMTPYPRHPAESTQEALTMLWFSF